MLNYLRLTDNASCCPNGFTDSYNATGNLQQGEWRDLIRGNQGLLPRNHVKRSLYSNQAIKMRNAIEDFVNSEVGSVTWQEEYVTRTSHDRDNTTNEHEF